MLPADVEALFTRQDGSYLCARWGRPLVPIVFGVEDETLSVIKGAFEAVCSLAGAKMAETDPELGANVMVFFFRDWAELLEVPDLGRLIEDLEPLVAKLQAADANQYRAFRFDHRNFVFFGDWRHRLGGCRTIGAEQELYAILLN